MGKDIKTLRKLNAFFIWNTSVSIRNSKVYTDYNPAWLFFSGLNKYFNSVIYGTSIIRSTSQNKQELNISASDLVNIPVVSFMNFILMFWKWPVILFQLAKNIKKTDITLLRTPHPATLAVCLLCFFIKKPLVFLMAGNLREVSGHRGLVKKLCAGIFDYIEKKLARHHLALVTGKSLLNQIPGSKLFINSPVDNSLILKEANKPSPVQRQTLYLLYAGRLAREKGIPDLLDAVKLLYDNNIPVLINKKIHLHILGKGPVYNQLIKKSQDLNITRNVTFAGVLPFNLLINYYDKSDVLIVPSYTEGIPKVILEAMARKLPVIATNVGGIPSIISHMHNGILIPPGSACDIYNSILTLCLNDKTRNNIIKNGTDFIKEHTLEKEILKAVQFITTII